MEAELSFKMRAENFPLKILPYFNRTQQSLLGTHLAIENPLAACLAVSFDRFTEFHTTGRSKSVNSGFVPQYQIVRVLNTIKTNKRIRISSAEIFATQVASLSILLIQSQAI